MMILLCGLCEVQNRVIDGGPLSSLAHGFLRLGRSCSHDAECVCGWCVFVCVCMCMCVWGKLKDLKLRAYAPQCWAQALPLPCVGSPLLSV